jgi:hypothetical protein
VGKQWRIRRPEAGDRTSNRPVRHHRRPEKRPQGDREGRISDVDALRASDQMSPIAAVIADTHVRRRAKVLPEGLLPHLERADLILHAGDLMDPTPLATYAPVRAVRAA